MNINFPGHYRMSEHYKEFLWKNCLFIFDTNTLLNLYHFKPERKANFLAILDSVKDRMWFPHQAYVEFHKNRLNVIQRQVDKFDQTQEFFEKYPNDIADEIESKLSLANHPTISADNLVSDFTNSVAWFLKKLTELRKDQPGPDDIDENLAAIEALFKGRVGPPPESQKWLDDLYAEGSKRYSAKTPPGYADQEKKKKEADYQSEGLVCPHFIYQRSC